jgi:hypothetical protein
MIVLALALVNQLHYSEFREFLLEVRRADRTSLRFLRAPEGGR